MPRWARIARRARSTTFASGRDKPLRPIGEWNASRVLVKGNHVEHWLNGRKVVEYELGSRRLKAAIAKSKFKDVAGFGDEVPGISCSRTTATRWPSATSRLATP